MGASDELEYAALLDLHAAGAELTAELGLQTKRIDNATISVGAVLPSSAIVVNRALVPAEAARDADLLSEIAELYRLAEVERFFLQMPPPGTLSDEALEFVGLAKARGWQKFRRGREAAEARPTDLKVRQIGPEHGADFGRIVCAAFDLGPDAEPWLAKLPGRVGWHVFMSFEEDTPAGCGALFVKDGKAWSDWGATDPAFRQRGSQSAVLAARINHAIELGCDEIFTCTGEDVPGDPQHSYNNILRMGFVPAELRTNYQPA